MGQADDHPDVIAYRVGQLERSQAEGFARLEAKLDVMNNNLVTVGQLDAAKEEAKTVHREINKKIAKLEEWNTWAVRIVLGAVIIAVVSSVLVTKGV